MKNRDDVVIVMVLVMVAIIIATLLLNVRTVQQFKSTSREVETLKLESGYIQQTADSYELQPAIHGKDLR